MVSLSNHDYMLIQSCGLAQNEIWEKKCTWMSIDALSGELSLFLLYVNKFQNRLHRIDATKHTLPTIQRSLSCKKFSMVPTSTPSKSPHNCSLFFLTILFFVLAVCLLLYHFLLMPVWLLTWAVQASYRLRKVGSHSKGETWVTGRERSPSSI